MCVAVAVCSVQGVQSPALEQRLDGPCVLRLALCQPAMLPGAVPSHGHALVAPSTETVLPPVVLSHLHRQRGMPLDYSSVVVIHDVSVFTSASV